MAGRRPKPSALHEIEGTRNRRKNNEPQPTGVPTCPPHLDKEAKAEWKRISSELLDLGLLTSIDRAALAAYCAAWSRWINAEENLQRFGTVIKSPKSGFPIQNPHLGIANTSLQMMHRFATEFGLTPASRTRIHVASADENGEDAFETFMRGIGAMETSDADRNSTETDDSTQDSTEDVRKPGA